MKKRFVFFVLVSLSLLLLVACGGAPTPAPEPTNTAVAEIISPTETATGEPPTATPPVEIIPTEAEPTEEALFPTPEVTETPAATPTEAAPEYVLTILEPAPAATLLAGREVTFRGEIQPPISEPILLTLTIGSFTAVSSQITPNGDNGSWELTTTLAESASGPGLLTAALGDMAQAQQANAVVFDNATDQPYISLTKPVEGETAVGGYTFFMQGDSRNLIEDAFTIGVLVDGCTNFIAAQKISLSGGPWYGFVILPQNATAGPACVVAYTGEYGQGDWREAIIPIQLRAYDDLEAVLLDLGNLGELRFNVGQATNLFGVVAHVPGGAVDIMVEQDSVGGNGRLIASGKAFADQFGFWSIDLAIPDDAPRGPALLTIFAGEGENYQEIRIPVAISP